MAELPEKKPRIVLGIQYAEREHDPPPGLVWRKIQKEGETLGSIADEYGVRAIDLMLYNWGTVNPLEVNWYMRHFMGSKKNNGKWYSFSLADKPGQILVPDIPPSIKKGPPKAVNAARNGAVTIDTQLQVIVVEWLASGRLAEVSGKWLYVFSGKGGKDFGSDVPPPPPGKDGPPDAQPGTAYDRRAFPGVFHIKEKPDKLEYEILITSEEEPSRDLMISFAGQEVKGTPQFKVGRNWHYLSDPTILAKATTDGRETRTTHAFRNAKGVIVDLAQNKRYYFLLSPVQLGPVALTDAMNNPKGLTPLLKPGDDTLAWDPTMTDNPYLPHNTAPTIDDIKSGFLTLPVIDPYAWAEDIAEKIYPDGLEQYTKWLGSLKNQTIEKLKQETGWPTLDHLYVAKVLDSVRTHHPNGSDILDELKDSGKWVRDLRKWEDELTQKNGDILAAAHRGLVQLIEWLKGPGHAIIDTAIIHDTNAGSSVDAVDQGWGILHWSLCTQNMTALAPGITYLKEVLTKLDTVPDKMVFKYIKAQDIPTRRQVAFRFAYPGVLNLWGLRDFVSPSVVPFTGTRQEFLHKQAEEGKKRRDDFIKFFNDLKLLPFKLEPLALPELKPGLWNWSTATTAANAMIDISDKFTTYVIDENIHIPKDTKSFFINRMAAAEEWFDGKPKWFRNSANLGTAWGLKAFSVVVSSVNLYKAVTTAGYDYQKEQSTVSTMDWAGVAAGSTLAIQDVLASVAALIDKDKNHLARIFPELTTSGGKFVVAARITGVAGRMFAGLNVFAMFVSGVTTMVSMTKSARQSGSVGDETAAAFYFVGVLGGAMMATGAIVLGVALVKAGGVASATGAGATLGVVLFFIGGIIAAIGAIAAVFFSSDDYVIFARKCFFGKQGDKEPRFGLKTISGGMIDDPDPPDWTHALKSGTNTWPIDKQKRAIHNLLGKFAVKTRIEDGDTDKRDFEGDLAIEIVPGLIMEDCTFELALHYGKAGHQTSRKVRWLGEDQRSYEPGSDGNLFSDVTAFFNIKSYKGHKNMITVVAEKVRYQARNGELLTTVTLQYPDLTNVIRCRKLVMKPNGKGVQADGGEVTSGLFE